MSDQLTRPSPVRRRLMIGLGAVFCMGLLALILTPALFRGLSDEWQFRLIRRFPFMTSWQIHPTAPFESLPTIDATSGDAAALLLTPQASATPTIIISPTLVLVVPSSTATRTATKTQRPPTTTKTA